MQSYIPSTFPKFCSARALLHLWLNSLQQKNQFGQALKQFFLFRLLFKGYLANMQHALAISVMEEAILIDEILIFKTI